MRDKPKSIAEAVRISDDLLDQIRPLLAGHSPPMQGILIVELLAIWLAGHHPSLRNGLLQLQLDTLPDLIELWHERLRGDLDDDA